MPAAVGLLWPPPLRAPLSPTSWKPGWASPSRWMWRLPPPPPPRLTRSAPPRATGTTPANDVAKKMHVTVSGLNGSGEREFEACPQQRLPTVGHIANLHKMERLSSVMKEPEEAPPGAGAGAGEPSRPSDPLLEPSAHAVRALDSHFDKVFAALGPRHATARYLRRRLAAELHLHVEQRSRIEGCSLQAACSRAVLASLRMHERFLDNAYQSKKHCVNSKYHNLLYAVAKLCFDCRLQDSEVVCCLLKAIFWCENSLDNLVVGALLGIVSTHVFNAWKSDFESRQENLQALDYFLEQAGRGGLRFDPDAVEDEDDVDETAPVLPPGAGAGAAPVPAGGVTGGGAGGGAGGPLRPAALVATEAPHAGAPPVRVPRGAGCVRVLLRAVRWVEVVELSAEAASAAGAPPPRLPPCLDGVPADVMVFAKGSPEEALVPAGRRRGAAPPPPLKHLARCAVRAALREARALPFGLDALELPAGLRAYVDLQED
ncbi:Uncharacterized protein GBIM_00781 [Gryllus bimaculatus]|nr:Uncharacterized protein GBIM_00781 [Gryllus bimaculatus]